LENEHLKTEETGR